MTPPAIFRGVDLLSGVRFRIPLAMFFGICCWHLEGIWTYSPRCLLAKALDENVMYLAMQQLDKDRRCQKRWLTILVPQVGTSAV